VMASPEKDRRVKTIGILAGVGFLISLYLLRDHYAEGPSVCDASSLLSCSVVNRSAFSELLGVPVAIFGAIWCVVLCYGAWRVLENDRTNYFLTAILLWSFLGIFFIFYMVLAEFILGAICIFCTIVHILTVIIFYHAVKLYNDIKVTPEIGSFVYTMRYVLAAVVVACIIPVVVINAFSVPDPVMTHDLASCLTSKHVRMYGSDGCGHCMYQKGLFGESFAGIDYVDCTKNNENEKECERHEIIGFPTWIKFDGDGDDAQEVEKARPGAMSLSELANFADCVIASAPPEPALLE